MEEKSAKTAMGGRTIESVRESDAASKRKARAEEKREKAEYATSFTRSMDVVDAKADSRDPWEGVDGRPLGRVSLESCKSLKNRLGRGRMAIRTWRTFADYSAQLSGSRFSGDMPIGEPTLEDIRFALGRLPVNKLINLSLDKESGKTVVDGLDEDGLAAWFGQRAALAALDAKGTALICGNAYTRGKDLFYVPTTNYKNDAVSLTGLDMLFRERVQLSDDFVRWCVDDLGRQVRGYLEYAAANADDKRHADDLRSLGITDDMVAQMASEIVQKWMKAKRDPLVPAPGSIFDHVPAPGALSVPKHGLLRFDGAGEDDMRLAATNIRVKIDAPRNLGSRVESDIDAYTESLGWTFGGRPEAVRFLREVARSLYYGPKKRERALFLYGRGGDGKSRVISDLQRAMGESAFGNLSNDAIESHDHNLDSAFFKASMDGFRLAWVNEMTPDSKLKMAEFKKAVSGEAISERIGAGLGGKGGAMRMTTPEFNMIIASNGMPKVGNSDLKAFLRRVRFFPTWCPTQEQKDSMKGWDAKRRAAACMGAFLRAWELEEACGFTGEGEDEGCAEPLRELDAMPVMKDRPEDDGDDTDPDPDGPGPDGGPEAPEDPEAPEAPKGSFFGTRTADEAFQGAASSGFMVYKGVKDARGREVPGANLQDAAKFLAANMDAAPKGDGNPRYALTAFSNPSRRKDYCLRSRLAVFDIDRNGVKLEDVRDALTLAHVGGLIVPTHGFQPGGVEKCRLIIELTEPVALEKDEYWRIAKEIGISKWADPGAMCRSHIYLFPPKGSPVERVEGYPFSIRPLLEDMESERRDAAARAAKERAAGPDGRAASSGGDTDREFELWTIKNRLPNVMADGQGQWIPCFKAISERHGKDVAIAWAEGSWKSATARKADIRGLDRQSGGARWGMGSVMMLAYATPAERREAFIAFLKSQAG